MAAFDMEDMRILELDSFEVPYPMTQAEREEYRRRFLTLFVPPEGESRRGGSGLVCKVRNAEGEVFAMKRIAKVDPDVVGKDRYPRMVEAQREAFRKEFENQQRLSGLKGFPKLYGYGMAEGDPLIVMEWVEGETVGKSRDLRAADPQGRRVPPLVVAQLGAALFDLVSRFDYLDDSFVHRDISPNNIMIRTTERSVARQMEAGSFDLCLIDFGSSTAPGNFSDPSFTVSTSVLRKATPEYAPPEMLSDDLPDLDRLRRSSLIDVYAIGSVLYELLCGETPFRLGKLDKLPGSYYRYKISHKVPLPLSLHAGMTSVSDLSKQPRLGEVVNEAIALGGFDQGKFVEAVEAADKQLSHIIMKALAVEQGRRSAAWEMRDMLGLFSKQYGDNILRRYRGEQMLPFINPDSVRTRPKRVIPLSARQGAAPSTVLYASAAQAEAARAGGPVAGSAAPAPLPAVIAPAAAPATAGRGPGSARARSALPAVAAGAVALVLAIVLAALAQGQPGTLHLFGKVFTGRLPFAVCLLGCLLPPAVSVPFYWLGEDGGQRLLSGTVAMVAVAAAVWWLVHATDWVVAAVEPLWSLALVAIVCACAIAAWLAIDEKEDRA